MYLLGVNSLCTMKLAVETTPIADYSNHKWSKFSSWWNFMCQKKYLVCFFFCFFVFAFLILSMHRLENVLTLSNRFSWIVIINPIFLFFLPASNSSHTKWQAWIGSHLCTNKMSMGYWQTKWFVLRDCLWMLKSQRDIFHDDSIHFLSFRVLEKQYKPSRSWRIWVKEEKMVRI